MQASKVLVFLVLVMFPAANSGAENSFFMLNLPKGVTIDAPRYWWALDEQHNNVIATSRDAALDLSGLDITHTGNVLFAAASMPRTTYASLRVSYDGSQPVTSDELFWLRSLSDTDLRSLVPELVKIQAQLLAQVGFEVVDIEGLFNETYGDYTAWSFRYMRTGPGGPVIVDTVQIFRPDGIVRVNLAYRKSEHLLWEIVIRRIKESIQVE